MLYMYRIAAMLSAFAVLGTLGALDTETISAGQAILQFALSFLALGGSAYKLSHTDVRGKAGASRRRSGTSKTAVPIRILHAPDVA